MRTLVLGGARSGKSAFAEALLADAAPVRYVATARPMDAEMAERIRLHRERRPAHWQVTEVEDDLAAAVTDSRAHHSDHWLLVDGLTLWLATVLERHADPRPKLDAALEALSSHPRVIVVSEEVGGGIVPADPFTRRYRDLAGEFNQQLATVCDQVVLVTAGLPLALKGALPQPVEAAETARGIHA